MIHILIMIVATPASTQSGASAVAPEFSNYENCIVAGKSLAAQADARGNFVLAWGCFKK